MHDIEVKNLSRHFKKKVPGKTLFRKIIPKTIEVKAVDNISFKIKKGEFVGYVGANGSGKSTTIKMLTGIIIPTRGKVKCLGYVPWKQRIKYTKHIGVVFGQKSLLWWDLPVIESLKLYRDIYEVPEKEFQERLELYDKMLGLKKFLDMPVRKLSFGERMRCELAASLLHKPKVLFLDEPTVGMDVVAKEKIRNFLKEVNEKEKTTIMLTTHDMGDIEALCKRIILLDKGKIVYDGKLEKLKKKYVNSKKVTVTYSKIRDKKLVEEGLKKVDVIERKQGYIVMRVGMKKHRIKKVITDIIKAVEINDILVEEPELEEIIGEIYKQGEVK